MLSHLCILLVIDYASINFLGKHRPKHPFFPITKYVLDVVLIRHQIIISDMRGRFGHVLPYLTDLCKSYNDRKMAKISI